VTSLETIGPRQMTGVVVLRNMPIDMTRSPCASAGTSRLPSPGRARVSMPSMSGTLGP
jgi:hypothetical protein